jgi:hypothetical protein
METVDVINKLLNEISVHSAIERRQQQQYKTFEQLKNEWIQCFPHEHEHAILPLYIHVFIEHLQQQQLVENDILCIKTIILKRIVLCFYLYLLKSWFMLRELIYNGNSDNSNAIGDTVAYYNGITPQERLYILKLLLFGDKAQEMAYMMNKTPLSVLNQKNVQQQLEDISKNPIVMHVLNEMKKWYMYELHYHSLKGMCSKGISKHIYLMKDECSGITDPSINIDMNRTSSVVLVREQDEENVKENDTEFLMRFEPRFERPAPDMLPISYREEVFWLFPTDAQSIGAKLNDNDFIWCESSDRISTLSQFSISSEANEGIQDLMVNADEQSNISSISERMIRSNFLADQEEIGNTSDIGTENDEAKWRRLFSNAFSQPLKPIQQNFILQHMDQYFPQTSILTPNRLSDLVQQNTEIAYEALKYYILHNHRDVDEYLSVLANMQPVCIQSMAVVRLLLTSNFKCNIDMEAYMTIYIHNVISSFDRMEADIFKKKRLARLFAVFLKHLIQREVIDLKNEKHRDLTAQIQSFCVSFSTVKEVNELFRFIKERLKT